MLEARRTGALDGGAVAARWLPAPDLVDLVRVAGGLGGEARLVRLVDLRARAGHLAGGGGAGGGRVGFRA